MELNNLNDDCLMEIIENLNLVDLINISKTNKRFNELARSIFCCKYSRHRIEVNGLCISAWQNGTKITNCLHHTIEPDFQAFFYYFGGAITNLSIRFDDVLTPKLIERNFLNGCDNIIELNLCGIIKTGFNVNCKKFMKVKKLTIESCCLFSNEFKALLKWFPAVIDLEINDVFETADMPDLIPSDDATILQLKKLKVINSLYQPSRMMSVIAFECIEEFELIIQEIHRRWMDFILELNSLKRLTINQCDHRNRGWTFIDDEQLLIYIELPCLEEMTLDQTINTITVDTVKQFILNCKSLKRFTLVFHAEDSEKRKQFVHAEFTPYWRHAGVNQSDFVIEKCQLENIKF